MNISGECTVHCMLEIMKRLPTSFDDEDLLFSIETVSIPSSVARSVCSFVFSLLAAFSSVEVSISSSLSDS